MDKCGGRFAALAAALRLWAGFASRSASLLCQCGSGIKPGTTPHATNSTQRAMPPNEYDYMAPPCPLCLRSQPPTSRHGAHQTMNKNTHPRLSVFETQLGGCAPGWMGRGGAAIPSTRCSEARTVAPSHAAGMHNSGMKLEEKLVGERFKMPPVHCRELMKNIKS